MGKDSRTSHDMNDEIDNNLEDPSNTESGEEALLEADAPDAGEELSKALALVDEFKEALQRERADFQNFRRRTEKERENLRPTISAEVMKRFLPIIDDFERAIDMIPEEETEKDWVIGIIQIHRKFQNALEAEEITPIDPLGQPFDPHFHEALGTDDASEEYESGQVTAVLQKGYARGDKVLRPAMVRVAN